MNDTSPSKSFATTPKDRLLRGGCWINDEEIKLQTCYHGQDLKTDKGCGFGFRCRAMNGCE